MKRGVSEKECRARAWSREMHRVVREAWRFFPHALLQGISHCYGSLILYHVNITSQSVSCPTYRACQENYEDSQRTFIGCDKLHLSRKKHDGFSSQNSFNALDTARSTAEIWSHIYIQICHAVLNRTQSLLALAYMVFMLWVIGGRAWFCKFRRWCRLWCCEMCGSDSTQDIWGRFNHLREKQMWDT